MIETIRLKGGAVVHVDFDNPESRCKKCKMTIRWAITKRAKYMPICKDTDGGWVSHFSNCRYADSFRVGGGDGLDEINRQKEREAWV